MVDIGAIRPTLGALSRRHWKIVILASLGSGFEIYDFVIYGIFAREIASQFFPSSDPLAGLAGTFSVFALGYFVRPLSAMVLGSLGDRLGRRAIFLISIFAMSLATLGIGLVPSYASIGILAPISLVLLRMIQGAFLAGELPCSIAYVVEEMPEKAGLAGGLVIFCLNIGTLAATFISFAVHAGLSQPQVESYGWRIAFLVGGLLGLASCWFRTSLTESEQFRALRAHAAKRPLREVLRQFPKQVAIGAGVCGLVNSCNTLLFVVMVPYLVGHLHQDPVTVSAGQNTGLVFMAIMLISVACLSDRIPPRYFQRVGAVTIAVFSYPFFRMLDAQAIGPIGAFMILGLVCGFVNGTYAYLVADLFPTRVRFSGAALSLNISALLFTGIIPLAVTFLMNRKIPDAPAFVIMVVAGIAFLAGLGLRRMSGRIAARDRGAESP